MIFIDNRSADSNPHLADYYLHLDKHKQSYFN